MYCDDSKFDFEITSFPLLIVGLIGITNPSKLVTVKSR